MPVISKLKSKYERPLTSITVLHKRQYQSGASILKCPLSLSLTAAQIYDTSAPIFPFLEVQTLCDHAIHQLLFVFSVNILRIHLVLSNNLQQRQLARIPLSEFICERIGRRGIQIMKTK